MSSLLDWLLFRRRPGAMRKWGELWAEFGVLWLTFGWLEELRLARELSWKVFAWYLVTGLIGLAAMRKGVKIFTGSK
jgi:hypothetical protein